MLEATLHVDDPEIWQNQSDHEIDIVRYTEAWSTSRSEEPEIRLCYAVFMDAFQHLVGNAFIFGQANRARRERLKLRFQEDAREWFADTDDKPFSFVFCAQHLFPDVDPQAIQQRILRGEYGGFLKEFVSDRVTHLKVHNFPLRRRGRPCLNEAVQ